MCADVRKFAIMKKILDCFQLKRIKNLSAFNYVDNFYDSRTGGFRGEVFVNGNLRDLEEFRRMSCYIQQDDRIQPLLTVQENMSLATDFKLGPHVSQKKKDSMVRVRNCIPSSEMNQRIENARS